MGLCTSGMKKDNADMVCACVYGEEPKESINEGGGAQQWKAEHKHRMDRKRWEDKEADSLW